MWFAFHHIMSTNIPVNTVDGSLLSCVESRESLDDMEATAQIDVKFATKVIQDQGERIYKLRPVMFRGNVLIG